MTAISTDDLARYEAPNGRPDEDQSKGWVRRLWPVVRPMRRGMAIALFGTAIGMLARTLIPFVLMLAIDNALDERTDPIAPYAWALVVLTIISFVAGYASRVQMFKVAFRVENAMRYAVYEHLSRMSASFYDRSETGQLLARANGDIRAVQMFLNFGPFMVLSLASLLIALVLMLTVSVPLTLVTIIPIPIVAAIGLKSRHPQLPAWWLVMARQADVATLRRGEHRRRASGAELCGGEPRGRPDGRCRRPASLGTGQGRRHLGSLHPRPRAPSPHEPRRRPALRRAAGRGGGESRIGALVAFSSYVVMVQVPFRFIGHLVQMAQRAKASAIRVYEVFDEPVTITEPEHPIDLVGSTGALSMRDVRFGYGGDADVLRGSPWMSRRARRSRWSARPRPASRPSPD